ncbi:MAG: hypothetical protein K6U88_13195 [Dehalococcoidia bacterium]|nr:hypothetical protein [Dehalococcoidia bacterium]
MWEPAPGMRVFAAFALGLAAGAIGAVFRFTVDPDFEARMEAVAGAETSRSCWTGGRCR